MSRILVLHASVGTGHRRAAEALEKVFQQSYSQSHPQSHPHEVLTVDVFDYAPKLFRVAYARSYLELTDKAPLVWGYLYSQTNDDPEVAEISNNIRKIVESIGLKDLKDLIKRFSPDCIICTHSLPMEVLMRLKRNDKLPQPVYCVVTDYSAHTFWTYTDIDGYFVGNEATRDQLAGRGVDLKKIQIIGIPVDPDIAQPKDKTEMRQTHGFATDRPLVSLFGGGVASEHIRVVIEGILAGEAPMTLVVVAGRNPTLLEAIEGLEGNERVHLRIESFIDYVDDLVAASELVVTKAGGLIVSEVLARGVPLMIVDPILGHEEWNTDYVVSHGAGIQLRLAHFVPRTVHRLLQKPFLLDDMQESARKIGRPTAAQEIVDTVMAHLAQRHSA